MSFLLGLGEPGPVGDQRTIETSLEWSLRSKREDSESMPQILMVRSSEQEARTFPSGDQRMQLISSA